LPTPPLPETAIFTSNQATIGLMIYLYFLGNCLIR